MAHKIPRSGYAPVNGLQLYYEIHGGLGTTGMFDLAAPTTDELTTWSKAPSRLSRRRSSGSREVALVMSTTAARERHALIISSTVLSTSPYGLDHHATAPAAFASGNSSVSRSRICERQTSSSQSRHLAAVAPEAAEAAAQRAPRLAAGGRS